MQIHRMLASFGKLQADTLELKDGLNIIQAPNESGKSTWCAFLMSMFYGINSRERDRAGFIANKNRYAPWTGAPMSGRLDCCIDGTDITLTRTTRRQTAPMSEFQAVYAGTNDTVSALNGQNCGETLLGVSREVYERSAFIRQAGLSITQDSGLERRIAALITTGEEDTSYSESTNTLKKQLNRRRHNKTGQIPQLETELQVIRQQLAEITQLEAQLQSVSMQSDELSTTEAALTAELALHQKWEAHQKRQSLKEAEATARTAEERVSSLRQRIEDDRIPENETIGRLRGALVNLETARKAVEKARAERDEAAKALLRAEATVNESPFAGQTAESAKKEACNPPKVRANLVVPISVSLALFAVLAGAIYMLRKSLGIYAAILISIAALVSIALQLFLVSRAKKHARSAALMKQFGTSVPEEISALAENYIKLLAVRDEAQAESDKRSAAADTLYNTLSSNEQAILLEVRRFAPSAFDSAAADSALRECAQRRKALSEAEATAKEAHLRYELLAQQVSPTSDAEDNVPVPERSYSEILSELEQTRAKLITCRSSLDQLTGRLHAAGDPVVLQSTATHLESEIRRLESEFNAIRLAMETLEQANTTLQNRFSPALGRRAAEIFHELTGGRYGSVALDRTFHLSAEPTGDTIYRDAQLLSAGTVDQLYLATRLAICELVLPSENPIPIILDDALTNFDDDRCATALRWLKEAAKTRQILLFTCHSREAEFFSGDVEVFVQQLTNPSKQV